MSGASRRGITEDKSKRIGEGAAYLSRFWRQFMACPGARERGTARREAGKNIWRARTRSASGGRRRRRGKAVGERSIRCVHAARDVDPGGLPLPINRVGPGLAFLTSSPYAIGRRRFNHVRTCASSEGPYLHTCQQIERSFALQSGSRGLVASSLSLLPQNSNFFYFLRP